MATTTLITTAGEDARLVVAFGTYLRLGRNATQAEIKAALGQWLASVVDDQERIAAFKGVSLASPIAPT